jgi:hypothetical protein
MKVTQNEIIAHCWGAYLTDELPEVWHEWDEDHMEQFWNENGSGSTDNMSYYEVADMVESDAYALKGFIEQQGGEVV